MKYLVLLILTAVFILVSLLVIIFAYYWGPKGKPKDK